MSRRRLPAGWPLALVVVTVVAGWLAGCAQQPRPHERTPEKAGPANAGADAATATTPAISALPAPPAGAAADADADADEQRADGPPEARPPALGVREARQQVRDLVRGRYAVMSERGVAAIRLHDVDRDGYPEVFALGLPPGQSAAFERLSDVSRLFDSAEEGLPFALLVFGNRLGRLSLAHTVEIGRWIVFQGFALFPVEAQARAAGPAVLVVSFSAEDRTVQHWLAVSDPWQSPRLQVFDESVDSATALRDIDRDGRNDLLVARRDSIEGTAYEVFLTWLRWDGADFVVHRTTNIVANLRAYLAAVREALLAHDVPALITLCIAPDTLRAARRAGHTDEELLRQALGLADYIERDAAAAALSAVRAVVFPEVRESPFGLALTSPPPLRLAYRISDLRGRTIVAEAELILLANPFGARQFAFALPAALAAAGSEPARVADGFEGALDAAESGGRGLHIFWGTDPVRMVAGHQ